MLNSILSAARNHPSAALICGLALLLLTSCAGSRYGQQGLGTPACCEPILKMIEDWQRQQAAEGPAEVDDSRTLTVSLIDELTAGDEIADTYEQKYDVVFSDRLQAITDNLGRLADRPVLSYQARLLDKTEQLNAFSIWGGRVYVTRALIETTEFTDGELAFVLGHEIAHAALRHLPGTFERARSNFRSKIALCMAARQGNIQASAVVPAFQALEASHSVTSAEQEFEADQYGALYMVRAGYKFSDAISALRKLRKLKGEVSDFGTVPEEFMGGSIASLPTHPPTGHRIEELEHFRNQLLEISDTIEQAVTDLDARRYEQAARAFGNVLKVFPESRSMRLNLALTHHLQYRDSQPDDDDLRGVLCTPERLEVAWAALLTRTPAAEPNRAAYEEAGDGYRETLKLDPDHFLARNNLAVAYLDYGESERAIEQCELALRSGREYAPLYKNLAMAYCRKLESGRAGVSPGESETDLRHAVRAWEEYKSLTRDRLTRQDTQIEEMLVRLKEKLGV